jgi:hypothetical protein
LDKNTHNCNVFKNFLIYNFNYTGKVNSHGSNHNNLVDLQKNENSFLRKVRDTNIHSESLYINIIQNHKKTPNLTF